MSRLEDLGATFRNEMIVKNTYKLEGGEYTVSHTNALSNGDEQGKGEMNDSIGGITDINMRNSLLTKNKFKDEGYTSSNA